MEAESLVINYDNEGNSYYCRGVSNATDTLQLKLKTAYSATECIVTNSGMAAITAILQGCIFYSNDTNFNIIYGDEMYCDVDKVCKTIGRAKNIKLYKIDIRRPTKINDLFVELEGQNNILLIESCTNPHGYIFDFSIIPALRRLSGSLIVIVDNTWLTHTVFSPFEHGADFVVLSLTKYYSAGHAIGGAILESPTNTSKPVMDNVRYWLKFIGHHISPHNSELISSYVDTIDERIASSYNLTTKVIDYLKSKDFVSEIFHPSIHSQELSTTFFNKCGPSIITFYVPCTKRQYSRIKKNMRTLKSISVITSYGSALSRLDPYSKFMTDSNGKKAILFRLALGYDDTYDNVIVGLEELFTLN